MELLHCRDVNSGYGACARHQGIELENKDRFTASLSEEGRYRLLIEAVIDYAIYMLDPSGIVTSWNPGARRFQGLRGSGNPRRAFLEILHGRRPRIGPAGA